MNRLLFILIFLLPTASGLFAQKDSIVFKMALKDIVFLKDVNTGFRSNINANLLFSKT
jgi:hypothetical protein